jgi:hypothetical protein
MAVNKIFECFNPLCGATLSFSMKELTQNKILNILCPNCSKKWAITLDGTSCCKAYVRFVSMDTKTQNTIVKVKSYPK